MTPQLRAGDLNQRIVIEQRLSGAGSVDELGQPLEIWLPVAAVPAQALPLRGREWFAAGATQSEVTVRFRIRYRSGLHAAMRVKWHGVAYALAAEPIPVDGQRRTLELMCKSGVVDATLPVVGDASLDFSQADNSMYLAALM